MQPSLVFAILVTFATVAVAYPTPEMGMDCTSLAQHGLPCNIVVFDTRDPGSPGSPGSLDSPDSPDSRDSPDCPDFPDSPDSPGSPNSPNSPDSPSRCEDAEPNYVHQREASGYQSNTKSCKIGNDSQGM
ncbi:hypothetical protein EV424DRAFT_1566442 [Suillus variegatus]|nr:hypothetical protein EV424DRAFT_1566442 [Suillus variegatus]